MKTITERIAAANEILALIGGDAHFELGTNGRLYVVCPRARVIGVVSKDGSLGGRYDRLGMGSTRAFATGLLLLWIRDERRRSLKSWERMCGPGPQLGGENGAQILARLKEMNYDDPVKTGCVFCGRADVPMDWFSHYRAPGCLGYFAGECVTAERRAA